MRKFWLGILINTALGLLFYYYAYYGQRGEIPDLVESGWYIPGVIFLGNLAGWGVFGISRLLNKFIAWEKNITLRLVIELILDNIVALTLIFLPFAAYQGLWMNAEELGYYFSMHREIITKLVVIIFFTIFIYVIIDFTVYSYFQYAVVKIQKVQATRKQLELQFEMLKSQLSPHYLFNCLNTISSLLYKDVDLAENFIRNFAQTYQYILDTNNKKLVKLENEVEFVKAYIFLLKVRFDEGLKVDIDLPSEVLQTEIPPLTLQLLVENAVKHNVISEDAPLQVSISMTKEKRLAISNNKTSVPSDTSSFEIGLKNIKRRYGYFTKLPIQVINDQLFTVNLPLLSENQPVTILN
ncbi:sensor histidine kinase [Flexithrix dorotheae]|uniref:sensor histidine kinase n=1 Tax=Flexithrix dorotheae TaxID=70993 RepID=UPI0003675C42|nr:histidine kinase [Flexithrix dorotheae]